MSLFDLFSSKKTCDLLVNVDGKVVEKYRHFQDFLTHNRDALNAIAELEQTYYGGRSFSMGLAKKRYDDLLASTHNLIDALNGISKGKYAALSDVCDRINRETTPLFNAGVSTSTGEMVLAFESLRPEMVKIAGSKATNLATVGSALGLAIPPGFVITALAFERFLEESGLAASIQEMLADITTDMTPEMVEKCQAIQDRVLQTAVPEALSNEILRHYAALEAKTFKNVRIAMRSSAVGEDTEASFAGQYITELNVTRENILHAYKSVVASKYSPRAILYRLRYGLDDRETPMCVAGIIMVDSRASGVMYTVDPSEPESSVLKISSIWGLGEHLVSGETSPDAFYVNNTTKEITRRDIARKQQKLFSVETGGTRLEEVPDDEKEQASIDDTTVLTLANYGLMLQEHFKSPQDVEWAVDQSGNLFILQARPLGLLEVNTEEHDMAEIFLNHPIILATGKAASVGTVCGVVVRADGKSLSHIPENAILVTRTASPDFAVYMGRIRGIITDIGGVASHLASVAREFAIPAIFDVGNATSLLQDGRTITMVADTTTVYEGIVPELAANIRPQKKHIFESPVHRRLRSILDKVSPLNLTDTRSQSFSPAGCKTLHDVIRFSHETVMKEMFLLSEGAGGGVTTVKLTTSIPLSLYCIDLGGGLKEMLTTCDTITPEHIKSIPMKALWSGFTHPGITWSGTVNFGVANFISLLASSATAEVGGGTPGGDSYAVLSGDYLNLSAKFGYHYANVDAYCSEDPTQNHILVEFSGGAGSFVGRSMRINFLVNVLGKLGLSMNITGDLLEANIKGCDAGQMVQILDQLGRLLASSRLLDMAIPNQAVADQMTQAFFDGDYDFLTQGQSSQLPGFYTHTGNWSLVEEDAGVLCLQDGSQWGSGVSSALAGFMGKMVGEKYQEFMDSIGAYYYFPIAIAKESLVSDAVLGVKVNVIGGSIDRAGGLVFGLRDIGNYFVLRMNALEDNLILFEYVDNKRFQRRSVKKKMPSGKWHRITVETSGKIVKGYLDDELLIEYTAEKPPAGYVGLWTKADSVTYFDDITIETDGRKRHVNW